MKNLLQPPKKTNKLGIYLMSMCLLTTITSCEACKNSFIGNAAPQKEGQQLDPVPSRLLLSTDFLFLSWFQTKFQITLTNEAVIPADLSEYTLKIRLQEEESTGNKLNYKDGDQRKYTESSIQQAIVSFNKQGYT